MAERHDENGTGEGPLGRRSYMKLAGSAGVALGLSSVLGGTAAASPIDLGDEGLSDGDRIDGYLDDYLASGTEVHVPPGTYEWRGGGLGGHYSDAALIGGGDPGDVELTAPDGTSRYAAVRGQGGEVRLENLLITGSNAGSPDKLRVEARDSGCDVVLDTVWLPDGTEYDGMGFFVGRQHAGSITFRNCWAEGFGDNGLYASAPGASNGSDGPVIVEGGLYRNNNIANVRLGSSDSVVRGATLVHDEVFDKRSSVNMRNLRIRQPGENMVIEDVDIYHSIGSYRPVDFSSQISSGSGVIRNTRIYTESSGSAIRSHDGDWRAENLHITGDGSHSIGIATGDVTTGSSATVAARRPRPPLPDSRDGGESIEGQELPDVDPHLVAFVTDEGADRSSYEFVADGPVLALGESPYESPSGNAVRATSNYEIDDGDDATTVRGHTGNGYGDAYEVYGPVTNVSVDNPDEMVVQLDGDTVTESDLIALTHGDEPDDESGDAASVDDGALPNRIVVEGPNNGDVSKYTFSVSGDVEQDDELTTLIDGGGTWDVLPSSVSGGTVVGVVGSGTDAYRYSGSITALKVRGDATVSLDRP